jgi:hypothetical protein
MRISGFSFARNAEKLYYPVAESIRSILPICDEFVITIGKGDDDDRTREEVAAIGDPRVRIIDTEWTDRSKLRGHVHGQQTNIALRECTGDWCFYIQADEIVHERYLDTVRERCRELQGVPDVEGLLFRYKHFWGDYEHYIVSHAWYPHEIRMIRNGVGIESWGSAQSFRLNGRKLRVAPVDAEIFHYGWVRPPRLMDRKRKEFATTHHGAAFVREAFDSGESSFDYGSLERLQRYRHSHPAVLKERVEQCDWKDRLQYTGRSKVKHKHDRFKYRFVTFIEQKLLGGRQLFGFKNYVLLKNV